LWLLLLLLLMMMMVMTIACPLQLRGPLVLHAAHAQAVRDAA
jgi:hypothetical protein